MHGDLWQVLAALYVACAIMVAGVGLNELQHDREFMAGKSLLVFVATVALGAVLWLPILIHASWQTLKQARQARHE